MSLRQSSSVLDFPPSAKTLICEFKVAARGDAPRCQTNHGVMILRLGLFAPAWLVHVTAFAIKALKLDRPIGLVAISLTNA